MARIVLATLGITAVVIAAAFLVFIYSGIYDIAASRDHTPAVAWALDTVMEQSVSARAEKVTVPAGVNLRDRSIAERGFAEYNEMCVMCHGAPGVRRAEWMHLVPDPPDLSTKASDRTDAELYWIVKHGIKMSGMPAFGESHKDEELWPVIALVRQLPNISPEEYQAMEQRHRKEHGEHSHSGEAHAH